MKLYVVPDIHGQRALLEHAMALIKTDGGDDAMVIFLGDLVDRGPDSRGVIQLLIDGLAGGRNWIVLRGNHDQLFIDFLVHASTGSNRLRHGLTWLHPNMGGTETLASYGVTVSQRNFAGEAVSAVPLAHREFLESRPYTFETDNLLFVHAGIMPGVPLEQQATDDLIWIREPFLSDTRNHGKLVVHGHTAIEFPHHYGNRVNLDGGAGWGRPLYPAVFEGRKCWLLTQEGRVALRPDQSV